MIKNYLTIIIPCKNEEKYITRTLSILQKQNDIHGTKIYIADANSTDNTIKYINDFKKNNKVLDIEIIKGGMVSVARNNGLKKVNTKYTLFLDADTVIKNKNHIKYYIEKMIKYDLHLMASPVYCTVDDFFAKLMYFLFNISNKFLSMFQPFSVGMFFLTDTQKVKKLGGFDETVIHSEDYLLSKKYSIKKFKIGKYKVGQDNRRFKRFGYFKMIKMLIFGLLNQNNIEYYRKDNGYWN